MKAHPEKHLNIRSLVYICLITATHAFAVQPKVSPASNEPNWPDLLTQQWALDMDRDLRNSLFDNVAPAALFQRVDKTKPVIFKPLIAFGVETTTHAGWYEAGPKAGTFDKNVKRNESWAFTYKQPGIQMRTGRYTPPQLDSGSSSIDTGDRPFGLWVKNDQFDDGGVFTQPAMTAAVNDRLKAQPYKAMIYPNVDPITGRLIPNSYIIGWEYSTNDDFQDVVTQIDNVKLLPADPELKGVLAPDAIVKKLAGGFKFVEGPAWDFNHNALYFSDIPPGHIIKYADGKATIANKASNQSNGLMFDAQGTIVACEHGGRSISRAVQGQSGRAIVTHYKGKRLNAPNDLWIDAIGGIYFTDPFYGRDRSKLEQDAEAVYYVTSNGTIIRIIDNLIRPNGIALSPDGKTLYVVDNGAQTLHRYPVLGPGKIAKGQRIAYVTHPDGMTVDRQGRLYITCTGGIWVLDANGKWLGLIETPEKPANCTFGGTDYQTLFITARTSLYAIKTQTRGWHIHLDGTLK